MLTTRPVGRGAAARKYDILTALGAHALAAGRSEQILALRLITLITARYNWGRDELTVGQREIARLWSVDERTVKREMAKLRGRGWLELLRAGARGRVAEYRLGIERLMQDTRPGWERVGPDFAHRLEETPADDKVVPLPVRGEVPPPDPSDGSEWSLARTVLHAEEPGLYASWIRALTRTGRAGGRLTLSAPSRFHAAYVETHLTARLLAACRAVDDGVTEIVLTVG
ncbi:DnaA N-terminal domain-containing protein (plasmid) [Limimaricola variabilis]